MINNNDSFFAEPINPRQEARALALEVICRFCSGWPMVPRSKTAACAPLSRSTASGPI